MVYTRKVVDLFAGCGGTSCGFAAAGFKPVCAVDWEPKALKTYAANFPSAEVIAGDVTDENLQNRLVEKYSGVDCVIMCPPCQAFSKRNLTTPDKENDAKNQLPFISANLVVRMKPKAVFMEEVSQCVKIAPKLVEIFESAGYSVQYKVLYASDYSVPQRRKRFILVATQPEVSFTFPAPTPVAVTAGEALNRAPIPAQGSEVSKRTRDRIVQLKAQRRRLIGGNYGLMDLSKPSPTIHTQSLSATGPYTIERDGSYYSMSTQEVARLQSFPSTYLFEGTDTAIRKQIGNSVPPLLAQTIANNLAYSLA